ncbi:hypothetical protein TNCV_569671 [Trichonephila clavipes]|nr:hypothetical protein TNCV_569671 [Trichonephila clavipes]
MRILVITPTRSSSRAGYNWFISISQRHRDITTIQICIETHDRKRLRSALGRVAYKSIGGNRPALSQSFERSSPTEEHETVLRTPSWQLCIRRKCACCRKIA